MRFPLLLLPLLAAAVAAQAAATLSTRMVYRLSDEARMAAGTRGARWPRRGSGDYYRSLVRSDLQRQKRRLGGGKHQLLSFSKDGGIIPTGNDFGWCVAVHSSALLLLLLLRCTVKLVFACSTSWNLFYISAV